MKEKYLEFLQTQKLKNTAQREALFKIVMAENSHFSVESLEKKTEGNIGMATLYRFLRLLVDSKILNEYHFSDKTLFERSNIENHHDHIICEKCGEISEFHSDEIENIQEAIMKSKGFISTTHRHELYGICKKCQ